MSVRTPFSRERWLCDLRILELANPAELLTLYAAREVWVALDLLFPASQTGLSLVLVESTSLSFPTG